VADEQPAIRSRPGRELEARREPRMGIPYRARVDERHFLNLRGFHGGA